MHQFIHVVIDTHYVESVQVRSDFWSVFSRIRTEYGPEITLYLDTFHAATETLSKLAFFLPQQEFMSTEYEIPTR